MSKKRLVSAAMAAAFAASLITGCGASGGGATTTAGKTTTKAAETTTKAAETTKKATASGSEGKVLNIQAWNEEFKSRMEDHYPGYEKVDATTGKIGDVTVKWTITPSKDNAYQNQLDKVLPDNEKASADDKVDIFLMEADYALKYVNADVTMSLKDLGISDSDISDQYKYTQDIVKDKSALLDRILEEKESPVMFADESRRETADYKFFYENGILMKYGKELTGEDITGEYIGIGRFSEDFMPAFLERMEEMIGRQEHSVWWENVIYSMCGERPVYVRDVDGMFWAEVDYIEDYERILAHRGISAAERK